MQLHCLPHVIDVSVSLSPSLPPYFPSLSSYFPYQLLPFSDFLLPIYCRAKYDLGIPPLLHYNFLCIYFLHHRCVTSSCVFFLLISFTQPASSNAKQIAENGIILSSFASMLMVSLFADSFPVVRSGFSECL